MDFASEIPIAIANLKILAGTVVLYTSTICIYSMLHLFVQLPQIANMQFKVFYNQFAHIICRSRNATHARSRAERGHVHRGA